MQLMIMEEERVRVAIEAYRFLLSGQMGASLSHAVPHVNPIEVFACYSETGPLPSPVSPIYSDYIPKTVGFMPDGTVLLYWSSGTSSELISKKKSINEIFDELLSRV